MNGNRERVAILSLEWRGFSTSSRHGVGVPVL
jgi:hypothetical protein